MRKDGNNPLAPGRYRTELNNPADRQPKDGGAGWIMGFGMPKPDTVESVLAEMRAHSSTDCGLFGHEVEAYADRLAAAHERKVFSEVSLCAERLARAKAAEGLMVLARPLLNEDEAEQLCDRIDAHLSGAGTGD